MLFWPGVWLVSPTSADGLAMVGADRVCAVGVAWTVEPAGALVVGAFGAGGRLGLPLPIDGCAAGWFSED